MPKFLIEVPHEAEQVACARVVQLFLSTGSHFLSNAEWGCMDGVHKSWMIVDVDNKAEAVGILPPALRSHASVVSLNRFSLAQIESILGSHPTAGGAQGAGGV